MNNKIAFIATGYIKRYDGVSVYTENLLKEFLEIEREKNKDIYIGKSVSLLLKSRIGFENSNNIRFIEVADNNFFSKMLDLHIKLFKNGKYSLVFTTNFMPLILISNVVKVIHDLSPEISPHLYSRFFRFYHSSLLKSAKFFDSAIAYISNSTKSDLEKFYNINEKNKKLLYLPNGVPFKVQNYQRPDKEVLKKYDLREISFLVVGRINRAKGFDRILEFCTYFDSYLEKQSKYKSAVLRVAGKQTAETIKIFKNSNLVNIEVVFCGYLDDKALNELYTKSQFCFFLSRNEGYGLPLVEALWFRSIPILSDIEIFNEIVGDDYPKFSDKIGYKVTVNKFIIQILKDKVYLKSIIDKLELILEKEKNGYKNAAENLVNYIRNTDC